MSAANYRLMRSALGLFDCAPAQLGAEQLEQAREQAAKEQAIEELVLRTAEASAVQIDDSDVEQAVEQIVQRFADAREFEQALADNGLDRGALASAIAQELRVNGALERVAEQVPPVSEEEIEQFYRRHPKKFWRDEVRTVRHILITINDDFAENRRASAYQRTSSLADQLSQSSQAVTEHFAQLAERYSECPSAMHGGLIGSLPRGHLYPELDSVLFRMEEGQVKGVIESPMGYHILLCEQITPPSMVPLEQVREKIAETIQSQRSEQAKCQWIKALQKCGC
ncbi:nitrogen fixation protein NifM [Halorhodospira halochloris]|uniref:nitrogen fixation protein NifM n=1 Tax=Halorhodospira halochloris TaxID=1052 RepID=UPI001EE8D746|nr:nitrogen fixation protein NifM [Halorhodospira halochloris]MCG5530523.1 nitrogen fixation protein NifM [Halorhodospira halochloris]